jgi:dihydropteroate synthase
MHTTKAELLTEVSALIAGINKNYAPGTKVPIAGVQYTASQLTSALQALITLLMDVDTAEAAYKAKLAAETAQAPSIIALVQATKGYVRATVGNQQDVLVDYGMVPRKIPAPLTAAEKAAVALKRAATRKARNTMGSKQKKAVTGATTPAVTPTFATPVPSGVVLVPQIAALTGK